MDLQKKLAIEEAVFDTLKKNKGIYRARQVQEMVLEDTGLEVTQQLVQKVMRKDLHMGYRLAKTVPIQANSERCLVLR